MTKLKSELLPEGFRDRLPPHADAAARINRAVLDVLASYGYGRISPAIAEFDETMAARSGSGTGNSNSSSNSGMPRNQLVRFSDPVSGHTLAIRGDITVQVGRIATTRLADEPRPLRLSYSGSVLRLRAAPLRPDREITQIGAELIGSDSVAAVSEVMSLAIEALQATGVTGIITDFTLPDLVETLAENVMKLPLDQIDAVRAELDMKNAGGLAALGTDAQKYLPLLEATGPFEDAVAKLKAIDAKGALASRIAAIEEIAACLTGRATITLDPTERHGFEYQSWFGFTLFAHGYAAALGRGGTYTIIKPDGTCEAAIGFSLYPDALIDGDISEVENKRLFLPLGTDPVKAARMRAEGWITVAALDTKDTAERLRCEHILSNGRACKTGDV